MSGPAEAERADELLPDEVVERLVSELTPVHRLFLAGLGRGLSPPAAARRAGWRGESARLLEETSQRDFTAIWRSSSSAAHGQAPHAAERRR